MFFNRCYCLWYNVFLVIKFIDMYTKENLMDALSNEFRIIKHLAEKIPADTEGYKPTEKQRTTLELLQYLTMIFISCAKYIKDGDMGVFKEESEKSAHVTLANFKDSMDAQEAQVKEVMNQLTDEDLETMFDMFRQGEKTKMVWLVESFLRFSAAYKMQLFLYIKSSGNTSLGTSNVWGGVDTPATQ